MGGRGRGGALFSQRGTAKGAGLYLANGGTIRGRGLYVEN